MTNPDNSARPPAPQDETPLPPGKGIAIELSALLELENREQIDLGHLDLWIDDAGTYAGDGCTVLCDGAESLFREIAEAVYPILKRRFVLAKPEAKEGAA